MNPDVKGEYVREDPDSQMNKGGCGNGRVGRGCMEGGSADGIEHPLFARATRVLVVGGWNQPVVDLGGFGSPT